jgi:tetratricopeptide (TPR) repeat protein
LTGAGYFNIGICYFQMGKHKDAIQAFKKSLDLQPHNADAHTNIANCYLMLKDIQSGVKHLEQATNFNPLDGEAQYNLGCVYDAMGQTDKAILRLQMASDAGIGMATKKLKQVKAKAAGKE